MEEVIKVGGAVQAANKAAVSRTVTAMVSTRAKMARKVEGTAWVGTRPGMTPARETQNLRARPRE